MNILGFLKHDILQWQKFQGHQSYENSKANHFLLKISSSDTFKQWYNKKVSIFAF